MSKTVKESLKLAIETGKVVIGSKKTLENLKRGKIKALIIAKNCPERIKKDFKWYAKLTKTLVYLFNGTSMDLGAACGRGHVISALGIMDPGVSDILNLTKPQEESENA